MLGWQCFLILNTVDWNLFTRDFFADFANVQNHKKSACKKLNGNRGHKFWQTFFSTDIFWSAVYMCTYPSDSMQSTDVTSLFRCHGRVTAMIPGPMRMNGHSSKLLRRGYDTASTVTSSDLESTSFFDSEDDCCSSRLVCQSEELSSFVLPIAMRPQLVICDFNFRYSTVTGDTSMSSKYGRHRQPRRRHKRLPNMSRVSLSHHVPGYVSCQTRTLCGYLRTSR